MFQRAKTLIAAAFCLLAAAVSAQATDLAPYISQASTGSATFAWANPGGPYTAVLSTSPAFNGQGDTTAAFSAPPANYPALAPNTTYYFKVKISLEAAYSVSSPTATWVVAPTGLYSISSFFTADSSGTAGVSVGWSVNGNPAWTAYDLQYSKFPGFSPYAVSQKNYPPVIMGGLDANTTYYFKVRARGVSGNTTDYTAGLSTGTLALTLSNLSDSVYETSATVKWKPVNGATQPESCEGYRLTLSTSELLNPVYLPWETSAVDTSLTILSPLLRNTTYYYKTGSLNWYGAANTGDIRYFTTLAAMPQNLSRLAVADGSATLGWTALPGSPVAASALGYRLEASTGNFSGDTVTLSSTAYGVSRSTLTITTLDPNTTYYFRTSSLNTAYIPNYSASQSSVTLALPLSQDLVSAAPSAQSITVSFFPFDVSPQAFSCEGYRLEGSTGAFGGSAPVFSSVTSDNQTNSLTLTGLAPNNVYKLRIATLNWERTPDYTVLPSTRTGFPGYLTDVKLKDVWSSSAAVSFTPGIAVEAHVAQASVDRFFEGPAITSSTPDHSATGLVISGLDPNTTYYYRVGALYNGATIYTNTTPDMRQTLPILVPAIGVSYAFSSTVTLSWTTLFPSPQNVTAEGYLLEASSAPDFGTVLASSRTYNINLDRLSIGGLTPNTSYYFRNGTFNQQGYTNYTAVQTTSTLANQPGPQPFGLTPASITLTWLKNLNPADTRYLVEMADNPSFSPALPSSTTVLLSSTFYGLLPNTTYYSRVTAINRLDRTSPAIDFPPMATGAYDPGPDNSSGIGVTGLTAKWLANSNTPLITNYRVEISSRSDFSGLVLSSVTMNLFASFEGLVSNASYYMRVSALNLSGVPTLPPVPLDSPLTFPATAYILPPENTFSGFMTDGFSVAWAANGNSSSTVYNVRASTAPDFSVINSSLSARGDTCILKDLLINTTYWVQVQAVGQGGALSAYETAGNACTLLSSQLSAIALQDNTISLGTSYGVISVLLPHGSIGGSAYLTLTPSTFTLPAPLSAVSKLTPTGVGLVVTYFPRMLILNAITITLPYRIADLPLAMRADRSKLILALFDETHAIWVPLPSVSDTANNRVIAQTWHLSTFQIMQTQPEAGLSEVKIYPNPYMPNSVSDVMHFTNMTPYAKVKIYTFTGELLREIRADVNGMARWDGLNDAGRKVASGVYIAFIQAQNKKTGKSFKIALER